MAQQDTYRCRDGRWIAVTLGTPPIPTLEPLCAATGQRRGRRRPAARAASPPRLCNDGTDLLRDTALAGVTLARDERGGLVKGLPYRLDGKGIDDRTRRARPRPAHRGGAARAVWATTTASCAALAEAGVTSTTPSVGDV